MESKELGRYYAGDTKTPAGRYLTATEAAAYIGITNSWFHKIVKHLLFSYNLPSFRSKFYLQTELNQFKDMRS